MSASFFVCSVFLYLIQNHSKRGAWNQSLFWSIVAGIIWALGFVLLIKSIDSIGLTRSNQWKNLQGPIGVISSVVILSEWSKVNVLLAVLSGLVIFGSANALNISSKQTIKNRLNKNIYIPLLAGVCFGFVTVLNKYVTIHSGIYSQQIVWSAAIFISMCGYRFGWLKLSDIKSTATSKDIKLGILAGLLYTGASFFMLKSYEKIPASIGFTIIQLNAVWTILIGVFYFKEISYSQNRKRILSGLLLALLGVALLSLAKK